MSPRNCILRFFIVLAIAFSVVPAGAQEATFESELTVTATGTEEVADEVPLSTTVIGRDEMDLTQTESVVEVLRRIPGMTVAQSGGTGSVTSAFVRGTESDHTLVMLDGIRLNSPYFGGFDFAQLSTAGLERVEVVRGPYSALWGADAVGGVVNLISGTAREGFSGSLIAEGGEGSWQRYEGFGAWGSEAFDVRISGLTREGEGDLENSDFDLDQLLFSGGWKWGRGSRIGVLVHATRSDLGIPFTTPGTLTPSRRQKVDQETIAVPLNWAVTRNWKVELTLSSVERELDFSDPDDPWGSTWTRTETTTDQVRLASHHLVGRHQLAWGTEWREDEVFDTSVFGPNLLNLTSDVKSLFLQDVWRVNDAVTLVTGLRWDDADPWGSEVSPRLNLGWQATDHVELRGGYGEAYRQPSVGELYYPFTGNPDLDPEVSKSWEAGLSWTGGAPRGRQLSLTYFSTDIEDMIQYDYITMSMFNIGRATIEGIEASLDAGHGKWLRSRLQATRLTTKDDAGAELLRRPKWSGAYHLFGAFKTWMRGSVSIRYVGERMDVDPVSFETATASDFVTADLALAFKASDRLEITVRSINLMDKDYEEVLGYPAHGRRVIAGVKIEL